MEVLLDVAQIAAAVMTIAGAIGMFIKWAVVKPIKLYIDQMTQPIQPGNNGGLSLTDLHKKVQELKDLLNKHTESHK